MAATAELRARGVGGCGLREIRSVLIPATLEILDLFAEEVTSDYEESLSVIDRGPSFALHPELTSLARALTGDPFPSFVLLSKGRAPDGILPVVVADVGTPSRDTIRSFVERLSGATAALKALHGWCRRPVPLSAKLWSALSVVEPAPFLAASAAVPRYRAGEPLETPLAPNAGELEDTLLSTAVQSFTRCRGMALRPGKISEHRHGVTWDRFALLPALDRALETSVFDVGFSDVGEDLVRDASTRVRMTREFSERYRKKLDPALAARLAPASPPPAP